MTSFSSLPDLTGGCQWYSFDRTLKRFMKIEMWSLDGLKPYERNARKIPQSAINKVALSLREFGWQQPIVVEPSGVIVVGHVRRLAALQNGWTEAPVVIADNLTAAQIKAYRLMDNRSHDEATWDLDLIGPELTDLAGFSLDLSLTGFDPREITKLTKPAGLTDPDEVPETPKEAVTRPGDLWLMGEHRLLCGDCTNGELVLVALGSHQPRLLVTDPPYGISLDMEWRDRAGHNQMGPANKSYMKIAMNGQGISGDTKADWSAAFALVASIDVAYVWHATSHLVEVAQGLERIGFSVRQQIIWNKTVAAMSRSAYHWKHEPCWYAVRNGATAHWIGTKDQTTIWEAASPKHIMSGSKEEKLPHPTQKPVDLMVRSIRNHESAAVYEPFCGSGTTMMAAEMNDRVCVGLEIEPRYADVTVTRWQNFTGRAATLDGDGRTFAEIAASRKAVAA